MAFPRNGVIEAPKIVPSAFGLLAVVDPITGPEDKWVRGFSQEWETDVYALYTVDGTDLNETKLAGDNVVVYYNEIKPFFIEVQEDRSTLGFLGIDRIARLKRQVDATSQRAIEEELWDGAIRLSTGHSNRALVSNTVTVINGSGLSSRRALAALEHGIARTSHAGEQGIIHATRDVIALLSSNSNMLFHEKVKDHLQTMGGTPVVTGSGYTGNGPRIDIASATVNAATTMTIRTSSNHYLQNNDTISYSFTASSPVGNRSNVSATVTSITNATAFTVTIPTTTANANAVSATGYIQQLGTYDTKWIYGTGTVKVYLGDVDVVNDNLAQAYDVAGNQNDMRLKAIRPAAAYFDTSIHLAVRVDLTA